MPVALFSGLTSLLSPVWWWQFDYLKSLEIEEKINKIRWCHISHGSSFLLSTNDKTVKLWKVSSSLPQPGTAWRPAHYHPPPATITTY